MGRKKAAEAYSIPYSVSASTDHPHPDIVDCSVCTIAFKYSDGLCLPGYGSWGHFASELLISSGLFRPLTDWVVGRRGEHEGQSAEIVFQVFFCWRPLLAVLA